MIYKVHKMLGNQQVVGAPEMDIKKAFNYISYTKLAQKIADLRINKNLIGYIQLFLTNK